MGSRRIVRRDEKDRKAEREVKQNNNKNNQTRIGFSRPEALRWKFVKGCRKTPKAPQPLGIKERFIEQIQVNGQEGLPSKGEI